MMIDVPRRAHPMCGVDEVHILARSANVSGRSPVSAGADHVADDDGRMFQQ